MRYPILFAVLLLSACGGPDFLANLPRFSSCPTNCGAYALGFSDTCDAIRAAEDQALADLAPYAPGDACTAIKGMTIHVRKGTADAQGWERAPGQWVRGVWSYDTNSIELADVPISAGAYRHELAHALDYKLNEAWRRDPAVCKAGDAGCGDLHYGWGQTFCHAADVCHHGDR